jgi:serine/threonine protein kinase
VNQPWGCPSDDRLTGLLAGTLDKNSQGPLEDHVGHCDSCQRRLEELAVTGPDWQTWSNRLDTLHFQRAENNSETQICPTCGGPLHASHEHALGETAEFPEGSPSQWKETQSADTMHRVSRLEKELPHIPGYEIESLIGRGGMGVVYRARQLALHRPVALKMIVTGRHATLQQLARFQIEAEALACLTHENIVQIHEFGEHDVGPYLALEFVEGKSLDEILKEKT